MAQSALKTCDICISASGSHYCLECCQYFCDQCKSMHNRQTISRNHKFESGSNVIPEDKSKCIDHNEEFVFICTSCDVPVCMHCVTGKHNGDKFAKIVDTISSLKVELNKEVQFKLDTATKTLEDTEKACKAFDLDIKSTINAITEEGTKLKAMIDRQIAQMITSLKEKTNCEKDKLSKVISDTKNVLDRCNELRKKNDQLQKIGTDASMIEKLKALKNESEKVQIISLISEPAVVEFSNKTVTDKDIIQLLGTYSISETKLRTTSMIADIDVSETKVKTSGVVTEKKISQTEKQKQKESGRKQYLYRCRSCGTEKISPAFKDLEDAQSGSDDKALE